MKTVNFRINYETKVKRKFEKIIRVYGDELNKEINELKITSYHKIENQFQATFSVKLKVTKREEIIFEILRMANLLWNSGSLSWTFNGPHIIKELLFFELILNNQEGDQPIKWAHIELVNNNQ